jgi:hypothetical protein
LTSLPTIPDSSSSPSPLFLSLKITALGNSILSLEEESAQIDTVTVLLGLKGNHLIFVEASVQSLSIPASNVDCERAFSKYGNVFTNLRTCTKPENLEVMLGAWFNQKE